MIEQYSYGLNVEAAKNNNVVEMYKKFSAAEIRADLQTRRTPLINVCMNLTSDFNKSSVIRANNAFLGSAVYIVGRRRFDKRGTVGTGHYENVWHCDNFDDILGPLRDAGYIIYAVDNIEKYNPINLAEIQFPKYTALVYGEEQLGLTEDIIEECDGMIYIQQFGSVRSLNVAQAAAVCMYEYSKQYQM